MALDLFVNYERYSNSSLFYRVTAATSPVFTVKLLDTNNPNEDLGSTYYVEYTINNGSAQVLAPDNNGFFILPTANTTFTTRLPCVCSISVAVSSTVTNEENSSYLPVANFSMSGIFVEYFPTIDFIGYPSQYINIDTGYVATLSSTNYTLSSQGISFYGEGHTEVINLSSAISLSAENTITWLIGNSLADILSSDTGSSVLPISATTYSTAKVAVSSTLGDSSIYPISVRVTNSSITSAGPILTYNDSNGTLAYYPFFASSLYPDGFTQHTRITKSSIKVMQYPEKDVRIVDSPFDSPQFILPVDYTSESFIAVSNAHAIFGSAMAETFAGTKWELQADSLIGAWSIETDYLPYILAYKFKLSYDKDTGNPILPNFKASTVVPTTVTLTISSFKNIFLNKAPYDWQSKLVHTVNTLSAIVNPLPFDKLYTPNYFNIKGQSVPFSIVAFPDEPLVIENLTITSPSSPDTLHLSNGNVTGSMTFNVIGVADLYATAVLRNTISGATHNTSFIYQDMVEIVQMYDDPTEEQYFHTAYSPISLTYVDQPRLSPNEWAIADNVNSIIEKIYTLNEQLISYTKVYQQKDKFYGYLKPAQKVSIVQIPGQYVWENPPKVWQDLDCTDGTVTDETASWEQFESNFGALTKTWEYQDCGTRVKIDPSCYQKYCIQWNWRWRTRGATNVDVTWRDAKSTERFAKKWRWEKCTIDAVPINCDRINWHAITTDPASFPIPISAPIDRCTIVDAEVSSQTDQIVIAHRNEIQLIDKDYFCNHVARNGMADDLISFQNIVGISTNSEGKVAVLDNLLPRVSIFTISKNDFVPFTTWGSYGLQANPHGLNSPTDIHLDQYSSVWIADAGNHCIKKFTIIGKNLMTITHARLEESTLLSVCVDSQSNVHCLTTNAVIVFNERGEYSFEYDLDYHVVNPSKINVSYNKEMIYITYQYGIVKYFRTGKFSHFTIRDMVCGDGYVFEGYNSISQDKFRNLYVAAGDTVLHIPDLQKIVELKAPIPSDLYWKLSDLLIHKEEYIQPWVYIKSFHRLWDNIELLRNSLFYSINGNCDSYTAPAFEKDELTIGQNEIVTNAVINRLSKQLWTNAVSLIKYFNPDCEN